MLAFDRFTAGSSFVSRTPLVISAVCAECVNKAMVELAFTSNCQSVKVTGKFCHLKNSYRACD